MNKLLLSSDLSHIKPTYIQLGMWVDIFYDASLKLKLVNYWNYSGNIFWYVRIYFFTKHMHKVSLALKISINRKNPYRNAIYVILHKKKVVRGNAQALAFILMARNKHISSELIQNKAANVIAGCDAGPLANLTNTN